MENTETITISPETALAPLNYAHYGDESEEADAIASQVKALRDAGVPGASIAVLVRTNRQTRPLEGAFIRAGFTFRIIGAPSFWARYQTQAVTSYLKVLVGTATADDLTTALGTPSRFLGKAVAGQAAAISPSDPFRGLTAARISRRQKANMDEFIAVISKWRKEVGKTPVIDIVRGITEDSGVAAWLRDQAEEDNQTPETNGDGNIAIVEDVALSGAEFGDDLAAFIAWVTEQENITAKASDLRDENEDDAVTVLSVHRSKGLEWPVVFIAGMSEGLMPHALSKTSQEVEEERRMAYVAMTRAEDALFVSSTSLYAGKVAGVSPFIVEAGLLSEEDVEEVTVF
jgi:DNA helicase II / ATP-dependent DNA helicase PcrA